MWFVMCDGGAVMAEGYHQLATGNVQSGVVSSNSVTCKAGPVDADPLLWHCLAIDLSEVWASGRFIDDCNLVQPV
jgi:hypothetical protein